MNNEITTKTTMGRAVKALIESENKQFNTIIKIARKYRRVNKAYKRSLGAMPQISIKGTDKTGKIISDLLEMDNIDFREVIRVTKKYRKAEQIRQKTIRLANSLDKDYGMRATTVKGMQYEQI